jgi:predicted Zn-dependent protease
MKTHRRGKLRSFLARGLAFALLISSAFPVSLAGQRVHQEEDGSIVPDLDGVQMTPEQQIALGEHAAARIRTQLPVLADSSPASQFVQKMGRHLTEKTRGYAWPYRFHVLALKDVNAFALPGGQIFVNLGTIQTTNESELAGIMAHEIAHVVLQHTAREAGKRKTASTVGTLGKVAAIATLGPIGGVLAAEALQMGTGMVLTKYSRADESEADLLGAQIMYDAGYDPFAFPEFFQRMADQPRGGVPFLSDHPSPDSRVENVSAAIQKFPSKEYSRVESAEFRAAKRNADSMRTFTGEEIARHSGPWKFDAEPNPALSATLDNVTYEQVRSFGDWKHHEQPGLTFDYPGNWEVTQIKGAIMVAPPVAVSPSGAMAYGVTIRRTEDGSKLAEVSRRDAQETVRSTSGVKILNAPDHLTVCGREAIAYELSGDSPAHFHAKPLRERIWLVTAQRADGAPVTLLFIALERDYDAIKGTFRTILKSLKLD